MRGLLLLFRFLAPVLLVATLLVPASAAAQGNGTVFARGLNAPRGMAWDPVTNMLLVADAGTGGDIDVDTPIGPAKLGMTGRIVAFDRNGRLSVVVPGLPSVAARGGAEITGVHGLALEGRHLHYVTDGHGPFEAGFGGLYQYDLDTKESTTIANLAGFEAENNPDGYQVDSNPYSVAIGPDESFYVADAGANDILWVDHDGNIIALGVIPGVASPLPSPERHGLTETDPVPTGIAFGPEGNAYISTLTGFPFANGTATLYMVTWADGAVSELATGLTTLTGVAVGPDGYPYAIELSQGFDLQSTPPGFTPNSGRVLRILPDGSVEVVADGLNLPTSLTFNPAGDLFVAVNGAYSAPNSAQILRWAGVAKG